MTVVPNGIYVTGEDIDANFQYQGFKLPSGWSPWVSLGGPMH